MTGPDTAATEWVAHAIAAGVAGTDVEQVSRNELEIDLADGRAFRIRVEDVTALGEYGMDADGVPL